MKTRTEMAKFLYDTYGFSDPLAWKLRGGGVQRYHTEPLPRQSVAEHSWRVRVIIDHLWPDASQELKDAAIYHDVHEGLIGDLPAPTKRLGKIKESINEIEDDFERYLGLNLILSLPDHLRLKVADYLELVLYCAEHMNNRARAVQKNGIKYVQEAAEGLDQAEKDRVLNLLLYCTGGFFD